MKNTIEIDIEIVEPGVVDVLHNQVLLRSIDQSGTYAFDIDTNYANNCLILEPHTKIKVNWVTMFGLGKDKLIYTGICKNQTNCFQSQDVDPRFKWHLEYSTPIFSWLHTVLNHGWLVGK